MNSLTGEDILIEIFSFLTPKKWVKYSLVNKEWYKASQNSCVKNII